MKKRGATFRRFTNLFSGSADFPIKIYKTVYFYIEHLFLEWEFVENLNFCCATNLSKLYLFLFNNTFCIIIYKSCIVDITLSKEKS